MSLDPRTRRPLRRLREDQSEQGAALVIVLVLLLVGGLLVVGLANAASNDLLNSQNFKTARSLSYDATSAINVAVQSIRYTPLLEPTETLNASPPAPCWPTTSEGGTWAIGEPTSPLPNTDHNNDKFRVWCSTRWSPSSAQTRTVTFSACTVTSMTSTATKDDVEATTCALHPLVQEVVVFDDYPAGKATPTGAACLTYCGRFMSVTSWAEHPRTPTVTYLSCARTSSSCIASPLSGPSTGGATIDITGTGFVRGSTVQFVEESSGTPVSDNVVLTTSKVSDVGIITASKVTFVSSTSLVVTVPAITEGSTYYVTVTTPVGTSAYGSSDVFTYDAKAPTVTSVCTGTAGTGPTGTTCNTNATMTNASGAVSGGDEVTIWGTNFLCLSSCETGGGPTVKFGSVQAKYVTIVSTSELTTTAPAQYETKPPKELPVTVTTPGGTSAATVDFDYVAVVPTVESVSPLTVTTKVTITGTGFVAPDDDTVSFVPAKTTGAPTTTCSGNTKSASSVTVETATTITATVPSTLIDGDHYYVTVTVPSVGTSSYYPKFTYVSTGSSTQCSGNQGY